MTTAAPDHDLPFWLKPRAVLLFIAAVTLVRLAIAAATGLAIDESYYTVWSTVPSAGYLDHPPMIAWFIAAGQALLGDNSLAVRLFSVLSVAITSLAVYRTGVVLLDRRTAGIAVIWFNVTLVAGLMFLATPDAPVLMFWALTTWAVAEFAARRNPAWWLAAGVFAGLALLSKYTAGFLGLGLLLFLVTSRERIGWLRLWQVWAGGVLALLVVAPNILWNIERDWAGVEFQGKRLDGYGTNLGTAAANLGDLLGGQALGTGLVLFVFVLIGISVFVLRRRARQETGLALPILTALPMVAFFVSYAFEMRVEANWVVPIWPMLSLVGAWAVVHVRPTRAWLAWPLAGLRFLHVPLGIAVVGLIYAQALWQPFELGAAVDRTKEMRGWDGLEREVAALAEAQGARWIAVPGGEYGLAGQLATLSRFAGSTTPAWPVGAPGRWGFLPPVDTDDAAAPAIYISSSRADIDLPLRYFETAESLGTLERRDRKGVLQTFTVFRVTGPLPIALER